MNYTRFYIDDYSIEGDTIHTCLITDLNYEEDTYIDQTIKARDFIRWFLSKEIKLSDVFETIEELESLIDSDTSFSMLDYIGDYIEEEIKAIKHHTMEAVDLPEGKNPNFATRFLPIGSIVQTRYGIGTILTPKKLYYHEVNITEPNANYRAGVYRVADLFLEKILSTTN